MKKQNFFQTVLSNFIWNLIRSKIDQLVTSVKEELVKKMKEVAFEHAFTSNTYTDRKIKELLTPAVVKEIQGIKTSPNGTMEIFFTNGTTKDIMEVHVNKSMFADIVRDPSGVRKYFPNSSSVLSLDNTGNRYNVFDSFPSDEFFIKLAKTEGVIELKLSSMYEIKIEKAMLAKWDDILPKIEEAIFNQFEPKTAEVSA